MEHQNVGKVLTCPFAEESVLSLDSIPAKYQIIRLFQVDDFVLELQMEQPECRGARESTGLKLVALPEFQHLATNGMQILGRGIQELPRERLAQYPSCQRIRTCLRMGGACRGHHWALHQ